MAKTSKPKLVQLFENLFWVNSPKDWIINTIYFKETLFISISREEQSQKIRRSFGLNVIRNRAKDLHGLATDCVDEIKTNIKNDGDII